MPRYRGEHLRRRANLGCVSESDFATSTTFCRAHSPGGMWVCTRRRGHRGDHVGHIGSPGSALDPLMVVGRWGPHGELTDSEEE